MGEVIQIDPEIERYPTLKTGTYGENGEAELVMVKVGPAPWDADEIGTNFQVKVIDPDLGPVNAFQFCNHKPGSRVPRFLAQLGVDHNTQRSGFQFDDGTELTEGVPVVELPIPVIVEIGERVQKSTGKVFNTITNLHRVE